eukprot:1167147-Rhodomonas_salina.1
MCGTWEIGHAGCCYVLPPTDAGLVCGERGWSGLGCAMCDPRSTAPVQATRSGLACFSGKGWHGAMQAALTRNRRARCEDGAHAREAGAERMARMRHTRAEDATQL